VQTDAAPGAKPSPEGGQFMRRLLGCIIGTLLLASPGSALVLCQKKSGAVFARAACKKKGEKVIAPVALGLQGPQGTPGAQGQPGAPGAPGIGPLGTCPPDAVLVGTTCVDKYEATVWQIPATSTALITKVTNGTVTLADLTGGGAAQVSPSPSCTPAFPSVTFPADGNWTAPLYAVSIPGVPPTACVTWFQANEACLLAGKRLLTNREWQGAASGTLDPGSTPGPNDCNTNSAGAVNTGSRANCKSSWGAFDMVGNVWEWVADWSDLAVNSNCSDWKSTVGISADGDMSCFGGPGGPGGSGDLSNVPAALIRGGYYLQSIGGGGTLAGVFAVSAGLYPSRATAGVGFRCAR
jgi:hypothetical protein